MDHNASNRLSTAGCALGSPQWRVCEASPLPDLKKSLTLNAPLLTAMPKQAKTRWYLNRTIDESHLMNETGSVHG